MIALALSEDERQAVLLALALMTLLRPGMLAYAEQIAERVDPTLDMFKGFRMLNTDEVKPQRMI